MTQGVAIPRTKVVASVLNRQEVLLMEIHDPGRDLRLYLPVGGGVEFGETIHQAARRELQEELGIDADVRLLGFSENLRQNGVLGAAVILDVLQSNPAAENFWRSLGFTKYGSRYERTGTAAR